MVNLSDAETTPAWKAPDELLHGTKRWYGWLEILKMGEYPREEGWYIFERVSIKGTSFAIAAIKKPGDGWTSYIWEVNTEARSCGFFPTAREAYFDAKAALAMWNTFGTFDYDGSETTPDSILSVEEH